MKKFSTDNRLLLVRRINARSRVQQRLSGLRHSRKLKKKIDSSVHRRALALSAPREFDLRAEETRKAMLCFLQEIRTSLTEGRRVKLCFGKTEALRPCGTLYFVANLEQLIDEYPGLIDCGYPRDDVVEQLFQHIGLLRRLGKEPRKQVTADNVINWHYASGTDASTNAFQALLLQHQDAMGGEITRSELYDCMSEAVTNTRKHAYPSGIDKELNRWWMFSQASEGVLTVAICDLGIGIPSSLLNKPEMRDYVRRLRHTFSPGKLHTKLIEVAVSSNRSSTGLAYRGKGLPQMLDFIRSGTTGGFRVQSSHGLYSYSAEEKKTISQTKRQPIRGTLVQWTLSLKN